MTRTQINTCPGCDRQLDAALGIEDPEAIPSEGDLSLCAYCGIILVFVADGGVRPITSDDVASICKDRQGFSLMQTMNTAQRLIITRYRAEHDGALPEWMAEAIAVTGSIQTDN